MDKINARALQRNVKNVVKNYSDAQVKVREATSNDPWGPSSTLMSEIADLTYNVVAFTEIMQMIWKRLNDHGKNWRHVYKALVLLEYLIKTGSEKVAQQCKENIFAIQTLKDFQHFEENKDQGLNVREKSKQLVALLKDDEKLKVERQRALKAKERFAQSMSYSSSGGDLAGNAVRSTQSYHEALGGGDFSRSTHALSSDLESARPQTQGEEELQLQLALAMSKEEAEQEEKLRKNEELRLQLALSESQRAALAKKQAEKPKSAIDDLLDISLNNGTSNGSQSAATDPWGVPLETGGAIAAANPFPSDNAFGATAAPPPALPSNNAVPNSDPWGGPAPSSNSTAPPLAGINDPWSAPSPARSSSATNDPWGPSPKSSNTPVVQDPWAPISSNNNSRSNSVASPALDSSKNMNGSRGASPLNAFTIDGQSNSNSRLQNKTPESFLGPNKNLVNLDALVSSKNTTTSSLPSALLANPFATGPVLSASANNPFQAAKPPAPTINQLRAQGTGPTGPLTSTSPSANLFSSQALGTTLFDLNPTGNSSNGPMGFPAPSISPPMLQPSATPSATSLFSSSPSNSSSLFGTPNATPNNAFGAFGGSAPANNTSPFGSSSAPLAPMAPASSPFGASFPTPTLTPSANPINNSNSVNPFAM